MHWVMHISILTAGPFGPAYEARQTGSSISQGRKAEAFPAHRAEAAAAGGATPMPARENGGELDIAEFLVPWLV